MRDCPACREQIPDDSRFCDQCGFHLSPIPVDAFQERAKTTPPLCVDEPIPLTRVKSLAAERSGQDVKSPAAATSAPIPAPRSPAAATPTPIPAPRSPAAAMPTPIPAPRSPVAAEAAGAGPDPAAEAATLARRGRSADTNTRKCRRFPLKVEVSYNSEHNFFTGFLQNLSEGGLFVATHLPARVGEVIEVSFSFPGLDRVCTAVCRVRWIREYNPDATDSAPGMGLQFSQLDSDVRAAIELFVGHREPIFYDD